MMGWSEPWRRPCGRPTTPDARAVMWHMITAYRVSQIVRTAALFSLAERCASGPVTAEDVAGAVAAEVIDTSAVGLAVDVGGSTGTLVRELMAADPALRAVVMDLPSVVPRAGEVAARLGLSDRLTVVGGDFCTAAPSGADLYLLRYVLHDWDDEECVTILQKCRAAMKANGRVCVLEMTLGTVGEEDLAVPSQDLDRLAVLHGKERTVEMFDDLLHAAGLRRTAVHETGPPMVVIEAMVTGSTT